MHQLNGFEMALSRFQLSEFSQNYSIYYLGGTAILCRVPFGKVSDQQFWSHAVHSLMPSRQKKQIKTPELISDSEFAFGDCNRVS